MSVGQLGSRNGFVPFAPSSLWNTDISASITVKPRRTTISTLDATNQFGRSTAMAVITVR